MKIIDIIGISLVLFLSTVSYCSGKNYYRAAVLEHVRFSNTSFPSEEIIHRNLKKYEVAVKTAAENEVDIIVFPEWGLFVDDKKNKSVLQSFAEDIPDPKLGVLNPCIEKDKFKKDSVIRRLSCLSKNSKLFLVANVVDKKKCLQSCDANEIESCQLDACPDDGVMYFNTNVVFNREGTLIVRYYKQHLWFEPNMTPVKFPENAFFETDFGNFTTCVCFDLSFKEPVEAVETLGIVNVAYPTYWYDHVPFSFATSFQQAWAFQNKVNLLAANSHYPGTGTGGSGIYSSTSGALLYSQNPDGLSKLLISNVPKFITHQDKNLIPLNSKQFIIDGDVVKESKGTEKRKFKKVCDMKVLGLPKDPFNDYRCLSSNVSHYEFVKLNKTNDNLRLCSNDFCCSLSYHSESMDENYYFGVSGSALKFYEKFSFGVESCFIARCESIGQQSCSNFLLNSNTVFNNIELSGNFNTKYVYPFSINNNLHLSEIDEWSFKKNSIVYNNERKNPLIFFGLYGRLYELDKQL